MNDRLDHTGQDPAITEEVRVLAHAAIRVARDEGCDCVPEVEMFPTGEAPWWFPMVRHDESCAVVRKFRSTDDGT